jgi:hypothetical protein
MDCYDAVPLAVPSVEGAFTACLSAKSQPSRALPLTHAGGRAMPISPLFRGYAAHAKRYRHRFRWPEDDADIGAGK